MGYALEWRVIMHSYVKIAIHATNIMLTLFVLTANIYTRVGMLIFSPILYFVCWLGNRDSHRTDPIYREIARR